MWTLLGYACTPPLDLRSADPSDAAIPGLSAEWSEAFAAGDALFEAAFREADGLGPVFIRSSCASCHADDGRGPGVVEKFTLVDASGGHVDDPTALPWGNTRRPYTAGGAVTPLEIPDLPGLLVTTRQPAPVFGRGYLEAVDEAAVLELEANPPGGVSGRANRVTWAAAANPASPFHAYRPGDVVVGRFGLKARVATLDGFAADALLGDMSLTSALLPDELPNPDGMSDDAHTGVDVDVDVVNLLGDYVRLIDIPARDPLPGSGLFEAVGCGDCHPPSLPTRQDYPIPQLAGIDAPIYSDLLVHDLGPAFGDGLVDGEAAESEWRTAPLIGLRFSTTYLHDGRASTVEEAIVAHGGAGSEASSSVDRFEALSRVDRTVLVAFVAAL